MSLKGSCLGDAVRCKVDWFDMPVAHCHYATRRKANAAAYDSTAGVMRKRLRWTAGEERLSAYESSPGKRRCFCSVCGTRLMAERLAQPHVILRVATLDDDLGTRPAMYTRTSQDAPWLTDGEDIPPLSRMAAGLLTGSAPLMPAMLIVRPTKAIRMALELRVLRQGSAAELSDGANL